MRPISEKDYHCIPYSLLAWASERMVGLYESRVTPDMSPYRIMILQCEAYLEVQEERRVFEEAMGDKLDKYFPRSV